MLNHDLARLVVEERHRELEELRDRCSPALRRAADQRRRRLVTGRGLANMLPRRARTPRSSGTPAHEPRRAALSERG